jgi:hypothetical protein
MNDFNFKKAFLTIGLSVCFSAVGLGIMKAFSAIGPSGLLFISPFMFGISIPLSNWTDVGILKLPKTLFAGVLSAGLFYIAMLFSATEFNMYLISGLNGLLLLWVYSILIETIRPTFIHYIIVLMTCLTAMGLSLRSPDPNGVPDFYFTVSLWTSFFTVGLTTSLGRKKYGC